MQVWSFWLHHAPIFSVLIPMLTAVALIALGNPGAGLLHHDHRLPWRRAISLTSATLGVITAISYLYIAQTGQIVVYQLAEWNAPFGIVFILDRLSALMVLLSSGLGLLTLWYASKHWDLQGRYFHVMLHFLLMGIQGAFLTGDLFNLFVFFEILLLASYVLLIHGQGKVRFQTGIHYVSINLVASAIFLVGLGLIYGNVGSLNMADVTRLMPTLHGTPQYLASTGALLLFVVFGIKAAMLPVGFWLPKSYAVATPPVAMIFTLMTKVGVYAILRVNGLVFADSSGFTTWQNWLLALALFGSLYGIMAALAAQRLKRFVGFMMLSSISTLLIATTIMNAQAIAALLYYLLHSTLVAAAFYLLSEWIHLQRGNAKDHLRVSEKMPSHSVLGLCFFMLAWIMAGLPPFTGFLGKFMLLQAALDHPQKIWIFVVVLSVSLLSIIAFCRVGFILFWKARDSSKHEEYPHQLTPTRIPMTLYALIGSLIVMAVFSPQLYRYNLATAKQLLQPQLYRNAVLKQDTQGEMISVQTFDANYVPENKYRGKTADRNVALIPSIVSPVTLTGEHISLPKTTTAPVMAENESP